MSEATYKKLVAIANGLYLATLATLESWKERGYRDFGNLFTEDVRSKLGLATNSLSFAVFRLLGDKGLEHMLDGEIENAKRLFEEAARKVLEEHNRELRERKGMIR